MLIDDAFIGLAKEIPIDSQKCVAEWIEKQIGLSKQQRILGVRKKRLEAMSPGLAISSGIVQGGIRQTRAAINAIPFLFEMYSLMIAAHQAFPANGLHRLADFPPDALERVSQSIDPGSQEVLGPVRTAYREILRQVTAVLLQKLGEPHCAQEAKRHANILEICLLTPKPGGGNTTLPSV